MIILTVRDLCVRIDNKSLLENLSFELRSEDRLIVIGPNGAGKTVMLKALLGLLPYSGEITWTANTRIGYVPQKIDADRHLPITFRDLYISKRRIANAANTEVEETCKLVGLTIETLDTPVGHLSGGQFQRALIGFALIGRPSVLLLDEPTASIDEPGEEHIYELIHRVQQDLKLAIIAVTHELSFVYRYATRVLCLNKRGLCIGTPSKTLTPEVLGKLYGESIGYYHHDHRQEAADDQAR